MRRKDTPFRGMRTRGKRNGIEMQNNNNAQEAEGIRDDAFDQMEHSLADGMNHVTKTIMHSRPGGIDGNRILQESGNDLVNSYGELRTHNDRGENIPMRPLSLKGRSTGGGIGENGSRALKQHNSTENFSKQNDME